MPESLKIVLPTDFSKQSLAALEWVKKLSNRGHAEVHCVNVVQEPTVYMPVMANAVVAAMPGIDQIASSAQQSLDAFAKQHLGDLETPAVAKVLQGRAAEAICGYAKDIDAQMIVMATRGQSGLAHIVLGSTAEGVVRQAECPVLTVRG